MKGESPDGGLSDEHFAKLARLATSSIHETTFREPPSPEDVSGMLEGYEILELLGRGGMGAVYRGIQKSLNRPVAVKLLPRELGSDPEFAARFEREARVMAKLNHPNIVQIYDFGKTREGDWFIALELVDGGHLHQWIHTAGQPALEETVRIMIQLCDALSFAHDHGLIHRDIKPANILLTGEGRIKIADFGLSKLIGGDGERAGAREDFDLTLPGAVMGTAHYMAPELSPSTGIGPVDHRVDLYSLGVVFFEMLTGEQPRGTVRAPSELVPACGKRVDRVVFKAMENDPDDRFRSALEMKNELLKISAGRRGMLPWLGAGLLAALLLAGEIYWRIAPAGDSPGAVSEVPDSSPSPSGLREEPAEHGKSGDGLDKNLPGQAFENSLGMRFVPVPIVGGPTGGKRVLFCIWETRVKDFLQFAEDTGFDWGEEVEFEQTPDHPAVQLTWDKAVEFCAWLTIRERETGIIGPGDSYRLPTDHEWSCAVGLGALENPAASPEAKDRSASEFPWGEQWPPPPGEGNYYGEENSAFRDGRKVILMGYRDSHPRTAPVGSYRPNQFGLFDLSGNVNEWCQDYYQSEEDGKRVLRGGSWIGSKALSFRLANRSRVFPQQKNSFRGFRCVLERAD